MKTFRQLIALAGVVFVLSIQGLYAQGEVLLREIVSREHSLHVGGVDVAPVREAASREISIHVENGADNLVAQIISREHDLLVSSTEAPPAVTGVAVNVSPTGESATLDWSAYNQWAVRDITRFDIYYSATGAFTSVVGMTPYLSVGAGNTTVTLGGLAAYQDHYFAIVAVDGLGNFLPAVTYSAAYVLSPQAVSREFSIYIGQEPAAPYRQVVSRELDLAIASPAAPPAITDLAVSVDAAGETATLDWSSYNQWAIGDIQRFDIYLSDAGAFSDVTGMTPVLSIGGGGTSAILAGLQGGADHFFAVVPVDAIGNFLPQVIYSAAYVLSPQAVSREFSIFVGQEPPAPPPIVETVAVANFSFETPDTTNFIYWGSMSAAQRTAFAWTGAGNGSSGPALFNNGGAWGFANVPDGSQGVSLQGDSSISRDFSIATGGIHTLTWSAASRSGQVNPYVIKLNGVTVSPVYSTSNTSWQSNSATFEIPAPGVHTITFAVVNPVGDNSVGIDTISLSRFLSDGNRPFGTTRELVSREISVVGPDGTTPAPVTGVGSSFTAVTSTSAFGAVDLDWAGYNELAQHDIVRYRVYVSNTFFESTAGLAPYELVQSGVQRHTVIGLGGNEILHFAVVAEDVLGNFNPVVRSYSAQSSIAGVGEVTGLAGVSGGSSITFTWQPPADTGGFLTGYRIRFGASPAFDLPPGTTSWTANGLAPASGHAFRISTLDPFGGESSGGSLVASTLLSNPVGLQLTAQGNAVSMSWSAVQPAALVTRYDLYRSAGSFTNVASAQLFATVQSPSAILGTFSDVSGTHYAVVAVNTLGGFRPEVVSIEATKQSQTINFTAPTPGALEIPLTATASSGLPVTFAASPGHVASVQGATLIVYRGGQVTVTATQAGSDDFWPATATQSLRLPPVVTAFTANGAEISNGMVFSAESAALRVEALDAIGVAKAEFFGRLPGTSVWIPWGTDLSPNDGLATAIPVANFPDGAYGLKVIITTIDGHAATRENDIVFALRPQLFLELVDDLLVEGESLSGTVSLARARATDLLVTLSSTHPNRLNAGPPIRIPAGETALPFTISATQNIQIQNLTEVRLSASAAGAISADKTITLLDDDWPVLTLTLDRNLVAEDAGANAVIATLTRSPVTSQSFAVDLVRSNPGATLAPAAVTFPAGSGSVSFPIGVIDDAVVDGPQTTVLKAELKLDGQPISQSAEVELMIADDEGPRLEFFHTKGWVLEGSADTITVRRLDADTSAALSVNLTASPADELVVPATVTIPAGQTEATFSVQAVADAEVDGSVPLIVTGISQGVSPAEIIVIVTDLNLPDLLAKNLTAPVDLDTEALFSVSYRLENRGATTAAGPFTQRLLLSTDPVPGNDVLLGQDDFTGSLNAGVGLDRLIQLRAPRTAGTYWLLLTADANGAVDEILETNNTLLFAQPITVGAAYDATVATAVTQVPANTPVVFIGSATMSGGTKVPHVMVNIHIRVAGTERIIAAITNSIGDFTTTWTPLPGEGGDYEIGACHPGVSTATTEDTFAILTVKTEFPTTAVVFDEGSSASFNGNLMNPTAYKLTGLSLATVNAPAGLNVQVTLPGTTLAPGQTIQAGVALTGAGGFTGTHTVTLVLTTDQGVTLNIPITLTARPLVPVLTFAPQPLKASALRGEQKTVDFTISNSGGAATGPIDLLLPNVPWMRLASPGSLPSIPPGSFASVTLLLSPPANEPLTLHTGTLVIDPANGASRSLPFEFRIVSSRSADLRIEAVDESYYFTAAAPKVAGATVTLRDAVSSAEITRLETADDGSVTFPAILEGWYTVEVASPDHTGWKGNLQVNAGETNFRQIFISRNWVTYNWTVEEVELQDRYRISVETTFETNVPAPVVTVTPAVLDVEELTVLGQTKVINFTIENHGLIAADHGNFNFDQHPFYEVTPLIENLGRIPAKSSMTVPVIVRRIGEFAEDGSVRRIGEIAQRGARNGPANVPCKLQGRLSWDYICGILPVPKISPVPVSGVQGNCNTGSGNGSGGNGEGGTTGGSRAGSTSVSFATPSACDCDTLSFLQGCLDASVSWELDKVVSKVIAKLTKVLPSAIQIDENGVSSSISLNGQICTCCAGDGGLSLQGSGSVSISIMVELIVGRSIDDIIEINGAWGEWEDVELDIDGFIGAKGTVTGEISLTGEYDCKGEGSICLEGKVGGTISLGGSITAEVEAKKNGKEFVGSIGGELTLNGSVEAWLRGCSKDIDLDTRKFEAGACANITANARLGGELTEEGSNVKATFGGSLTRVLAQVGTCADDPEPKRAVSRSIDEEPLYEQIPFSEIARSGVEIVDLLGGNKSLGICSKVKIRLDQDAVMTRSAFRGTLELSNNQTDTTLTQVGFDLDIRDAAGNDARDLFNIQVSKLTGLAAIDGTGQIGPQSAGSAQWTLIPRDTAALLADTTYTIGGTIRYDQGGTLFSIPVTAVPITVKPDAALHLKYFHQRDVLGDDPHTAPVEPSVPYRLAVVVENRGAGAARNLSIASAKPQIVDNEKGLLIDFQLIGTEVAGQSLSPSLTADFGTLEPGGRTLATWLMTSSLQGLFIDYQATFQHLDVLDDKRISLLKQVDIHEMIRMLENTDGKPAFLTNDIADIADAPDTVHLSDGITQVVTVHNTATLSGPVGVGTLSVSLTSPPRSGWSYLRIPDPGNGAFRLAGVTRSDGKVIPLDKNVWTSDRTFIGLGQRPIYENILHLADLDSTGSYTLTYAVRPGLDTTPPVSQVAALPAQSGVSIPVRWSGSDDQGIASYDVFVRTNGGQWQPWLIATTRTSAIYRGVTGNTYGFYSVAKDAAGNVQNRSASADASTLVSLSNLPPVIQPIAEQFIPEGNSFALQLSSYDPDGPAEELRFGVSSSVAGITIDAAGMLRWVTGESDGGSQVDVSVTVTDGGSPSAAATTVIRLTVPEINSPPRIQQVGPQSVPAENPLGVVVSASDNDIPTQTVSFALAPGSPSAMSIDPVSGLIAWTPTRADAGRSHVVGVIASDSGNPAASSLMEFSVNVLPPPNRAPVFQPLPARLWLQLLANSPLISRSVSVQATDPDGDPVTLSADLSGLPNAHSFAAVPGSGSGSLTWDTRGLANSTYTIPLSASDGQIATTALLVIRLEPNNEYWRWALGSLSGVADATNFGMTADPDGDGMENVFEMTFLRDPLRRDHTPLKFTPAGNFGTAFRIFDLDFKRHRDSDKFVEIWPSKSSGLGAWNRLATGEWQFFIDPQGNSDGRAETQDIRWRVYAPVTEPHLFYRVEGRVKP